MRQREFEVLSEQLLDVRPANVIRLLHLDDLQDLKTGKKISSSVTTQSHWPMVAEEWKRT